MNELTEKIWKKNAWLRRNNIRKFYMWFCLPDGMVFHFVFIIITCVWTTWFNSHSNIRLVCDHCLHTIFDCNSFPINIFYLSELAELGGSNSYRLFVDADIFTYTEWMRRRGIMVYNIWCTKNRSNWISFTLPTTSFLFSSCQFLVLLSMRYIIKIVC